MKILSNGGNVFGKFLKSLQKFTMNHENSALNEHQKIFEQ